jgi:valyl-tRNA synthetase
VEVDRDKPEQSEMWSFAYELVDGGEIVVATTRPETMLGDTAVVVHPDDDRYKGVVGKMVKHPFQDRTLPIIADPVLADPELGTGAVKVTPAHDPNDFECGKRNDLELIDILNDDGTLNENGSPFTGLDRFEARKKVKESLRDKGLARGEKEHEYAPGRCLRCRNVVEPKLSLQWFVDTAEAAEKAVQAAQDGRTEFIPKHQEHRYFDWLSKKIPWCISRQLWWGHRIPAWYCSDCDGITVSREEPSACQQCGSSAITQDEDVLDTWFSSGLWPFSTLGWPEQTNDLKTFYPTSVLETGYDIVTFWVSRMMMMGLTLMDDVPFGQVLLHPMIRDQDGNKMSKSRGNVIDPLDVINGISLEDLETKTRGYALPVDEIERAIAYQKDHYPKGFPQCGTDALRFTLAAYTGQDQDIRFSVERVEGYRKFGNKIWQAVLGFALPHIKDLEVTDGVPEPATLADRWILARLAYVAEEVNNGLESFRVGETTNLLYHFFWDELCSWYIELLKPILFGDDEEKKTAGKQVLRHALDVSLRLLHPLMPFVTEVLWQELPKSPSAPETIMLAPFPTSAEGRADEEALIHAKQLMNMITAVRTLRSEYEVNPSKEIRLTVFTDDSDLTTLVQKSGPLISALIRLNELAVEPMSAPRPAGSATAVTETAELLVPLKGIIDIDSERTRLTKEQGKISKQISGSEKKLSNEKFLSRAPEDVVAKEKAKIEEARTRLVKIDEALARLKEVEEA